MTHHGIAAEPAAARRPSVHPFGFWSAIATAICAAAALALAITMAPARSGPFCISACISYPFTDAAPFVPNDYIWMYPAGLMAPLFLLLVAYMHHTAPEDGRLFGLLAVAFATLAAGVLTLNYAIQLTVVQPSLLRGELAGLELLSQYNPHGLFIAFEMLGFLMMSVAFLFAALAFRLPGRLAQATRRLLRISFGLAVLALLGLAARYGYDLEYRYEVLVILIDWPTLIAAGIMAGIVYRRAA